MSPIAVFPLMGALAGWVLGTVTEARPAFVAVVCAVVALEIVATAPALDDPARARAWRRVEFAALIVGVKALHLFSIPRALAVVEIAEFPRSLFEAESVTAWLAGLMVGILVTATLGDLNVLGSGVDDAGESPVVDRLRTRLLATTAVLTLAAAYGVTGFPGLMNLRRSGEPGVFWAVTVFLGAGLLGLARASYAASAGRWERDGAAIDGPIRSRWMASAWVVAALVLAVAVAAGGLSSGVSGLPAIGVSRLGPVGEWIADALDRIGERQAQSAGDGVDVPAPGVTLPEGGPEPGSRGGEVFVWLVIITAVVLALRMGGAVQARRRPGSRSPARLGMVFRALALGVWSVLVWLARSLWAALRVVTRFRPMRRPGVETVREPAPARVRVPWSPADPIRRRIAAAYREFLGAGRSRGWAKLVAETPREYSSRVRGGEAVGRVTGAYEEARFSVHRLTEADAAAAEAAAREAVDRLADQ